MASLLDFAVILAILYVMECFRLMKPGESVLVRMARGRYRLRKPVYFPNENWGWVLLNPLRPASPAFTLRPLAGDAALDRRNFDVKAIEQAQARAFEKTRVLRYCSLTQVAALCIAFPVFTQLWGMSGGTWRALPLVIPVSILCAVTYARMSRGVDAADRWGNIIKLALYPVSVMRACDVAAWDALVSFDPAAAVSTVDREAAAQIVAAECVQLKHLDESVVTEAPSAEFRRKRLALLETFAKEQKMNLEKLLAAPAAVEQGERLYCPSCRTRYRVERVHCGDCVGMRLLPIAARK